MISQLNYKHEESTLCPCSFRTFFGIVQLVNFRLCGRDYSVLEILRSHDRSDQESLNQLQRQQVYDCETYGD